MCSKSLRPTLGSRTQCQYEPGGHSIVDASLGPSRRRQLAATRRLAQHPSTANVVQCLLFDTQRPKHCGRNDPPRVSVALSDPLPAEHLCCTFEARRALVLVQHAFDAGGSCDTRVRRESRPSRSATDVVLVAARGDAGMFYGRLPTSPTQRGTLSEAGYFILADPI